MPSLRVDRHLRDRLDGLRRHLAQHIALRENLAADHDGLGGQRARAAQSRPAMSSPATQPCSSCALPPIRQRALRIDELGDEGIGGMQQQVAIAAALQDSALVQHGDLFGEIHGLAEIVGDQSTVLPSRLKMDFNSCCRLRRIKGSRAAIGSSSSITAGSIIAARMMATRCFWPPLISRGKRCEEAGRSRSTTLRNSSTRASILRLSPSAQFRDQRHIVLTEICGNRPPSCGT